MNFPTLDRAFYANLIHDSFLVEVSTRWPILDGQQHSQMSVQTSLSASSPSKDEGQQLGHYRYTPLAQNEGAFRLIRLLPSTDFAAEIVCEVFESDLGGHPEYEALSYVWGDPTFVVDIRIQPTQPSVDYERVWITQNLETSLRFLRRSTETRCLWVDAICIDQRNDAEKSKQVPRMKDIYSQCTSDLIWLGEEQSESQLALATLQRLQSLEVRRDNEKQWTNELAVSDLSLERYQALQSMLVVPGLWQRVWVMQEIACCPRAEIILGHVSISWDVLSSILDHTEIPDFYHRPWGHSTQEQAVWDLFSKTQIISHQRDVMKEAIPHKVQSLLDVLARFRGASSTDPRDKIYGLLGLAADQFDIKPDYSKVLSTVYAEVVLAAIDRGKDLDIICQSQWPVGAAEVRRAGLPSYVPDFSHTEEVDIIFAQRNIFCAGDAEIGSPVEITKGRLPIHAIQLGELLPLKIPPVTEDCTRRSRPLDGDIFRDWMPDSLSGGDHPYHTGEDAFQAYWRTFLCDCNAYPTARLLSAELNDFRGLFSDWRAAVPKDVGWDKFTSIGDRRSNKRAILGQSFDFHRGFDKYMASVWRGWHFAMTKEEQYYCMVPHESIAGDQIVVVKGAKVPLVIRPTTEINSPPRSCFTLVGTAYVHGFMDGEAREWVRQGKLEEKDLFLI